MYPMGHVVIYLYPYRPKKQNKTLLCHTKVVKWNSQSNSVKERCKSYETIKDLVVH